MDLKLFQKIFNDFKQKNKLSITENEIKSKQYYRLFEILVVARKTLTANEETTINMDSFYKDYDLEYRISKKEFEELIKDEVLSFKNLAESFLINMSNLEKNKKQDVLASIDFIEMAGDALRIPIMQKTVEEVFGKRLSKTLAPDEIVSKGACIYSIMQSKNYSLNFDFSLIHFNSEEISIKFSVKREETNEKKESEFSINYKILEKNESVPIRKVYKISNPLEKILFEFYSEKEILSK